MPLPSKPENTTELIIIIRPEHHIIGSYMKYSLDYVTYLPDTKTYEDIVFKLKCKAKIRCISPRDGPPATSTYCR